MADGLMTALGTLVERLRSRAGTDPELRADLRALAQAILIATDSPAEAAAGAAAVEAAPAAAPAPESAPAPAAGEPSKLPPAAPQPVARPAPAETAVAARVVISPPSLVGPTIVTSPTRAAGLADFAPRPVRPEVTDADLPLVAARCRLKAEGSRWAAARRRKLAGGADFRTEIEPLDRDIIGRAKALPDCFLWMCHPSGPSPSDLSLLDDLGGCFENLAAAVELVVGLLNDVEANRQPFEQALDLVAEAQSALRVAIDEIGGPTDKDQQRAYHWARDTAGRTQIYVTRYMRIDDPADPSGWSDLGERIEALDSELQESRQRSRKQQAALSKIRYHLKPILSGDGDNHRRDWEKVIETVEAMTGDGVPPSNRDLRELLLPAIDLMPDFPTLPAGFQLVLREIDQFLSTRESATEAGLPEEPTPEVKRAAALLGGKSVVLIGGERRPHAQQSLRAAFDLKDLDWVDTKEHGSVTVFEPHVARPDVAVVLLAIRWSSHAYGDVKQFCDRYGKPLVRLPAGYNPNQVAVQVLAQCGERLGQGG